MIDKKETGAQQSLNSSSGVDESLLARQNSDKEGEKGEATNKEGVKKQATLRQRVLAAKRKKLLEKKKALKKKAAAPMRKGTNKLLQQAWINLIPSFGLTLIWINIHIFLSTVLGVHLFCKLGDEWDDGKMKSGALNKGKIGEKILFVLTDLIFLSLLLFVIVIMVIIYKAVMAVLGTWWYDLGVALGII